MENIAWIRVAYLARKFNLMILCAVAAIVTGQAHGQTSYRAQVLYSLIPPGGISTINSNSQLYPTLAEGSLPATRSTYGSYYWAPPSGTATDLTPTNLAGYTSVGVLGLTTGQEVGWADKSDGTGGAMLWNGSAGSAVSLAPATFSSSYAVATDGVNQVGGGIGPMPPYGPGTRLALMWSGTAASAVVLSSPYQDTYADAVAGNEEVGYGINGVSGSAYEPNHAMLWIGPSATLIDLTPTNSIFNYNTFALGTNGTQQVGYGSDDYEYLNYHALLWNGTAASTVDLNPTDLPGIAFNSLSLANATNGTEQVGYYENGYTTPLKAVAWFGTGNSAIDLSTLLPTTGSWVQSEAFDVDANDDVFGTALGTYNGLEAYYAIEWVPVPEPDCLALFAIPSIGWIVSGRCKRA